MVFDGGFIYITNFACNVEKALGVCLTPKRLSMCKVQIYNPKWMT